MDSFAFLPQPHVIIVDQSMIQFLILNRLYWQWNIDWLSMLLIYNLSYISYRPCLWLERGIISLLITWTTWNILFNWFHSNPFHGNVQWIKDVCSIQLMYLQSFGQYFAQDVRDHVILPVLINGRLIVEEIFASKSIKR